MSLSDPHWLAPVIRIASNTSLTNDTAIRLSIEIACLSAANGTAPFGAVLTDKEGNFVDAGWNCVISSRDSTAHAEIMALRRAEQKLMTHNLQPFGFTLYSSAAPCIQCFGALYWAGIERVVAGCDWSIAESYGFDEGPIDTVMWWKAFEKKRIFYEVASPTLGLEVRKPFDIYVQRGGTVY